MHQQLQVVVNNELGVHRLLLELLDAVVNVEVDIRQDVVVSKLLDACAFKHFLLLRLHLRLHHNCIVYSTSGAEWARVIAHSRLLLFLGLAKASFDVFAVDLLDLVADLLGGHSHEVLQVLQTARVLLVLVLDVEAL